MSLRSRFDAALGRSGIKSIAELARLIEVSAPSIFEVLAEETPGKRLLPKISEKIGVHERWLRFGDDDVKPPWALSQDTLTQHNKVSDDVKNTEKVRENAINGGAGSLHRILGEILSEQRRTRVLLESLLSSNQSPTDPAPRRRATIPRATAHTPPDLPSVVRDVS